MNNKIKTKFSKIFWKWAVSVFAIFLFLANPVLVAAETLEDLNTQINDKKQRLQKLDERQEQLKQDIDKTKQKANTLNSQLDIIESSVAQTETQIEKTEIEIEKTGLEIEGLRNNIEEKNIEIEKQKENLAETIRLIYEYDQISLFSIIFSNNSLSDVFDQLDNLEKLQNKGKELLDTIKEEKQNLETDKAEVEKQKASLDALEKKLTGQKSQLEFEKSGKEKLLGETKMEEGKFQELLAKARQEQESANAEIQSLQQAIQQKLQEQGTDGWTGGTGQLAWPVSPNEGISAYFMDPSYLAFFGINHYGIDIPAPQGTSIHAPDNGIVVKYHDAGTGYSYIMLYHGNNLSTVYGHASGCTVSEGQKVSKGDIIGYTGGTPGTKGAGWMTTGPHLHLEVRVNGNPVDPLGYLK